MASFSVHTLLPSLRVKVTALFQYDDRLYLGTATGIVQVYTYDTSSRRTEPRLELVKAYTVGKKPIEQIGVLASSKQLLVLSDLSGKGKPLSHARYAHCFSVVPFDPAPFKGKGKDTGSTSSAAKELVDMVIVGCRKKVVVYPGVKLGFKEAWELTLPHSPRHVVVPTTPRSSFPETAHLMYSATSSVILRLSTSAPYLVIAELSNAPAPPVAPSSSDLEGGAMTVSEGEAVSTSGGLGISSLGGLGGYVGLGGKAAVPAGSATVGGEVILAREDAGVFMSSEGHFTRPYSARWRMPPESILYSNPFIYSSLPAPPATASASSVSQPTIQIHLSPTLLHRQILALPPPSTGSALVSSLTPVSSSSSVLADAVTPAIKLLFVSTPTDRGLLQAEGSSVWALQSGDLGDHVDELVREGRVADAIGLVESVGEAAFSPDRRLRHLKTLSAVSDFALGRYQSAVETFLVYNINPALVIALYPAETISGRLHSPRDQWMELYGATPGARLAPVPLRTASADEHAPKSILKSVTAAAGLGLTKKASVDSLRSAAASGSAAGVAGAAANGKDKDTGLSEKAPVMNDEEIPRAALEALMYYLSDRRQKLTGAINSMDAPLPAESTLPPLASLPPDQLHALPSVPFAELEPEHLLRVAQVIYTALLKVYLVARPVLVGSLCRIENWCDVEEVEELLKAQRKFGDLIDLYQGKKMHSKALKMLHELAKDEDDRLDRYPPTVRYLQKLGPAEVDLIFESSKWVFAEDPAMAIQIFTADEPEVEALPRTKVVAFLEKIHEPSCIVYLEHIVDDLGEEGSGFSDKLAELYLVAAKSGKGEDGHEAYRRFTSFLSASHRYRANRLINKLPANSMPEARAILLGRMGKHEEALRIYIYVLSDHVAADRYCTQVYTAPRPAESLSEKEKERDQDGPASPDGIYLLLLRLYLRPSPSDPVLLPPALELIAKHSTRLDGEEVIRLLPPLVTMRDVREFAIKTLREGHARRNERLVVRALASARKEEVERALMEVQVRRVRVTDQRICPQCHKRLGQSAIAVHAPRGEVTHLHCKDPFSEHLAQMRG